MRSVDVSIVTRNIKEMCIQANHFLSEDTDGTIPPDMQNHYLQLVSEETGGA